MHITRGNEQPPEPVSRQIDANFMLSEAEENIG